MKPMRFMKIEKDEDMCKFWENEAKYIKERYFKELERNMKLERKIEELEERLENCDGDLDERFIEISNFWGDQMPMLAMEEAGELIQAISKFERVLNEKTRKNLITEMSDMLISMGALMARYGIGESELRDAMDEKLDREY